jgi:hypothetical protein
MLSLAAPEDTHVQHMQQMQLEAFFCEKADIFEAYTVEAALAIVPAKNGRNVAWAR